MHGDHVRFSPLLVAAGACLGLVVLLVVTLVDSPRSRTAARWLLGASAVGILAVTMLGSWEGSGVANLTPGSSIRAGLAGDHALGVFNVLGNVALFVPLGWLVALVVPTRRLLVAALVGFGLSAAIELVQSFTGRVVDVDDVILNGIGAVLGAGVALLVRAARQPSGDARAAGQE